MSLARPLYLSRSTAPAMASIGLVWGGLAAMVPRLKADLGLSDGELGVYLFVSAIGAIGAMALAPRINERAPRLALPVSTVAIAAAILALGFSVGPIWLFAVALVLVGMTTGLLDIIANARIAQNEARFDTGLMNLNHAIYSLSYAGVAVATGLARDAGLSTELWFGLVAGAVLLVLPLILLDPDPGLPQQPEQTGQTGQPEQPGQPEQTKLTQNTAKTPIPPVAIFAGIIAMLGFFAENATEHWSALHIERTLGQGAALGALGPAMLGLTMGIGRMAGHFVTVRGKETRLMRVALALASAGLMTAALAPTPPVAYLGFAMLGFGVSVVAPLCLAVAGQAASTATRARAVAFATMISYGGFFFGPPVMGVLAELGGLRAAFGIVALVLLVVPLALLPRIKLPPRPLGR